MCENLMSLASLRNLQTNYILFHTVSKPVAKKIVNYHVQFSTTYSFFPRLLHVKFSLNLPENPKNYILFDALIPNCHEMDIKVIGLKVFEMSYILT